MTAPSSKPSHRAPPAVHPRAWRRALFACALSLASAGCGASLPPGTPPSLGSLERPDGLDPVTVPVGLRADYAIFEDRCSQCHTLARPLNSDFSTMEQWRNYVRRMRRQPSSGISPADEQTILVFLEWFNAERNAERQRSAIR